MTKVSNRGSSALHYVFIGLERVRRRTWLAQRHQIGDILHENATLELQLGLASLVDKLPVGEFVFGLAEVDIFATKQDGLEEVDVILRSDFHQLPNPHPWSSTS